MEEEDEEVGEFEEPLLMVDDVDAILDPALVEGEDVDPAEELMVAEELGMVTPAPFL